MSPGGETCQVGTVLGILDKIGRGPDALACGTNMPLNKATARAMQERGVHPTVLHHNCSGKHAGMLALARYNGWPIGGYELARHPVQKALLQVIADFAGVAPDAIPVGVDGCSVCTFGLSLHSMATSFARLAQPDYWPEPRRSAVRFIAEAMTTYPEMVAASEGRIDTDLMRAGHHLLLSKAGAEAVHCVALLATDEQPAIGFALKLLDGDVSHRALNPAIIEGLRQAGFLTETTPNKLDKYWLEDVRNTSGDVVGMVRPPFTLRFNAS